MEIVKVLQAVKSFFQEYLQPIHKITSIEIAEDYWEVFVEVIEESEYMKSHAKDQILGVYQVQINANLEITSFKRINLRPRGFIPQS
jgi:dimeric dUTPase (all-alpha-NTP-PPase superfamily)